MKRLYLVVRSTVLWTLTYLHFSLGVLFMVLLACIIRPRRFDPLMRVFLRNVVRLSGARLRVRCAPGFDRERTGFFIANHVNKFDPFVLYSAIPQYVRGLELESHFRIPVYGWLMKRFGNIPVPDQRTPKGLKRTYRLVKEALENGTSVVVLPEGGRTMDGNVGPFQMGAFRMARQLGYPIVPVTMEGAYEVKRKGRGMLYPGTITVHIHDTIETSDVGRNDLEALRDRVRAIVAGPLRGGR